jgi:YidC/Oxa1 family membrane protein insertase
MIIANIIESAFSPLITVFEDVISAAHSVLGGSWGWAIIGLTLVVRVVTLPLTIKQFKSMALLQQHAPEMKKLQARYKDDKTRLNEEMMKFYKENNVNPLASCLPLLLQMPVFISLVYMLRSDLKEKICGAALKAHGIGPHSKALGKIGCSAVQPHSGSFLFIPDITTKAQGVVLVVLIVVYVSSMLVTTILSSVSAERNQRIMMIAMPFLFTIFILQFPAGLLVYWITTNLTTIPQQYFIRRRYARPPPVAVTGGAVAVGAAAVVPTRNGRGSGGKAAPAAARRSDPPPRSPRKRKKRSGRRR